MAAELQPQPYERKVPTEIGGEAYLRSGAFMVMGGITGGQNKGDITTPAARSWALLSKVVRQAVQR